MNAIEIENLCKSYSDFRIDNVSLVLPSGCVMGLIGENGAGKSTIIKCILDIVHKDSGSITVLGRDTGLAFDVTKENIGTVLDENGFAGLFNAIKVSHIMSKVYKNWDENLFFTYLDRLNVPRKRRIKNYSKGMVVKLNIAVALSHNAKLLIMDEPMNALDPFARDEITNILIEFTRDETHSILISSHIMENLERLCDYIAFIHRGRLLICDEKDALKERFCNVLLTENQLKMLDPSVIVGIRNTKYGYDAVAFRDGIPDEIEKFPVSVEDLFIAVARRENR